MGDRPTLNPVLRPFWTEPARYRVLHGGRASSKSWDAAGFAVFLANSCKIRVLCLRQFQNKIAESVYSLLKIQIERFGLRDRFEIQRDKIINKVTGSEFLFYGIWRHIDEIKSLESIDLTWIEEAHNLTEEQWKIIRPTVMRKAGSQTWIVFNPKLSTDFVWRNFVINPPPRSLVRQINYLDNPFLSSDMLVDIEADKDADYEDYEHIYLGVPRDDDDSSVIKRSWVMAAIDAHVALGIEPSGAKRIGFDVADSGADKCAIVSAHSFALTTSSQWKAREDELLKSVSRVYGEARDTGSIVVYDSIGVGASVGAKIDENNVSSNGSVRHVKFNAGAAVVRPESFYESHARIKNKDFFANLKAQSWWSVADRFRNTFNAIRNGQQFDPADLVSISSNMPNLDQLIDELCTPKRDYDSAGKVKVESKKDLAKRDIPSPNLADAAIMALAPIAMPMSINKTVLKRA